MYQKVKKMSPLLVMQMTQCMWRHFRMYIYWTSWSCAQPAVSGMKFRNSTTTPIYKSSVYRWLKSWRKPAVKSKFTPKKRWRKSTKNLCHDLRQAVSIVNRNFEPEIFAKFCAWYEISWYYTGEEAMKGEDFSRRE